MTRRDFGNIHTTEQSCWDTLPCATWHLNYSGSFTCWWRSLLVATSKFGLLTITRQYAARKLITATTSVHFPKPVLNDENIKIRFSFNRPNRKIWDAKLVDVRKHLPHKVFLLWYHHWKGLPTKAKEAPSPHEVRLTRLDINPVFQCLWIM